MEKSRPRYRSGNDSVEVTVKGPSTDDIKGTVEKLRNDERY